MEAVVSWIKGIACYVIIISMFQGILPDNRYKKYVQLFTGMLLVLLIAAPILRLTKQDQKLTDVFTEYAEQLLQDGLEGAWESPKFEAYYRAELTQMMDNCGYAMESCSLQFDREGQLAGIDVQLYPKGESGVIREVVPVQVDLNSHREDSSEEGTFVQLLAETYSIPEEQVRVQIRGE